MFSRFNPVTVNSYDSLFNCTPVRLYNGPDFKLFILVDWSKIFFACCLTQRDSTGDSLLLQFVRDVLTSQGHPVATHYNASAESSSLILHDSFRDLFVLL